MNLEQIKAVVEAYRPTTAADDMARLEFFEGIWQIQQRHADAAGQAIDPSTLPGKEELLEWYWACKPFLRQVPAAVDARRLAACAREIASYLIEKGSFSQDACGYLKGLRWTEVVEAEPIDLAGEDPEGWIEAIANDVIDEQGESDEAFERVRLTCMVLTLALRSQLQPVAEAQLARVRREVEEGAFEHVRPLRCPVCGGAATLAHVGPTASNKANVRTLYCGQCGSTWGFERVRCACCGTQHQGHLEYLSVEGDEAHRVHVCSECGGYMRTHFNDPESRTAFVPEIEDVMMVKLTALAEAGQLKACE